MSMTDFSFLAVSSVEGYEGLRTDGVIGLSFDEMDDDDGMHIHFIDELYNHGVIDRKAFTIFLGHNTTELTE